MDNNAFANGLGRGLGIFRQAQAIKNDQEDRTYNRQIQKQLFDMRLEDREHQRSRDTAADQRYQDSLNYRKERDAVQDTRHQEALDYRKSRDGVQDLRHQENLDYRKERDGVLDNRWQQNFDASKGIRALQKKQLQHQVNQSSQKSQQANLKRIAAAYTRAKSNNDTQAMNGLVQAYIGAWNTNPTRRAMLQKGAKPGQTKVMTGLEPRQDGRFLPEITTYDEQGNEVSVSYLSRDRSSNPQDPYMAVDRDAIFGDLMNDPDMAQYMLEAEAALSGFSGSSKKSKFITQGKYNEWGDKQGEDTYIYDESAGGMRKIPVLDQPKHDQPAPGQALPLPEGMTAQHVSSFLRANPSATRKDAINAWTAR